MASLGNLNPTYLDVVKRMDDMGNIDTIVELLNETNEILNDMTAIEGNLPTGNRTTIRTGLPAPTWRKLYGGVMPTKSTTAQVTDSCGMLEAYAEVDKALADLNGNSAAFRLSEDRAFLEAMSQEMARSVFYGDEGVNSATFTGLAPRYNTLSLTGQSYSSANAFNVIGHSNLAGQASAVSSCGYESAWLVVWGPNTCHAIYPKGSNAGFYMEDKGQVTVENANSADSSSYGGGRMEAYRSHYRWDVGLTLRDWRYVVRVANIGVGSGAYAGSINHTTANTALTNRKLLVDAMIMAAERVPNMGMGRAVWYVSRTIREALRFGILGYASAQITFDNVAGKMVMMFDGVPVVRCDVLSTTNEAAQSLPYTTTQGFLL